jgi:gas vesicle protein
MAIFGRKKEFDADELVAQLQAKQEDLLKQLDSAEFGNGKGGGGGRTLLGLLLGGVLGAGALYLLDPEKGEERRQSLLGSVGSLTGGGAEDTSANDQMVTSQVEGELARDADFPKGQININTVDGVVYVRGTANSQEQIAEIERRIKVVPGVDAVINLLRLPAAAQA